MVQHAEMKCDVTGISYDFKTRTGRVDMAKGNNADMRGCIDVFLRIDPKAKHIETFAGSEPDTSYHKIPASTGGWTARLPENTNADRT
ncbi:hypothetical protein CK227_05375 [Mesorhizobium sp. WSM4308]|nr:hypothetical protein CK232_09680 [Mesorhizobium sp. WSM4304]PBB76874.1 hypothetical protein CK227_05375 [Mesorhizobium sp. WSM4308]